MRDAAQEVLNVADRAARRRHAVQRFGVVSIDPLTLEAADGDEMLREGDDDLDVGRGVRRRLSVGDDALVLTDRDGDRTLVAPVIGVDDPDPDPDEGDDKSFVHDQDTPATVWEFEHGLGKFPAVQVIDTSGRLTGGVVTFLDLNNVRITFNYSQAGKAACN